VRGLLASNTDAGGGAVRIHQHCGFNQSHESCCRSPERRLPALLFGVWACVLQCVWLERVCLCWRVQVYRLVSCRSSPVVGPYRLAKLAHCVSTT
jgi:hypothetical protein